MKNAADVTGGKPFAVLLFSGVSAINPLVAFYDIHGGKILFLRISYKHGSVIPLNNDPTKQLRLRRRRFQSSLAHHWSDFF
jgi:hypothetical protein